MPTRSALTSPPRPSPVNLNNSYGSSAHRCFFFLDALEEVHAGGAHDEEQQRAGNETAAVRQVRDTVVRLVCDLEQLQQDPAAYTAVTLCLVLHELATNAAKHGALSTAIGRIKIGWMEIGPTALQAPQVELTWREEQGPSVQAPKS